MAFTPFTVTVTNWTSKASIDLTTRLLEKGRITVTDEQEREAFERVVGDLRFECGDQDGTLRAFLFTTDNTLKYMIEVFIYIGGAANPYKRRWRGEIEIESIKFDPREEVITFDAFSIVKSFWEKARITRVWQPKSSPYPDPFGDSDMWFKNDFINFEKVMYIQTNGCRDNDRIFNSVNGGPYANSRKIRSCKSSATYGNEGMFSQLAKSTLVADLVKACLIEYNAVVYIDAETGTLMFAPRGAIPATFTDITSEVLASGADISVTDGVKFDWLLSYSRVIGAAPYLGEFVPVNISPDPLYRYQLKPLKDYSYRMVGIYDGAPRAEGNIFTVTTPAVRSGYTGWAIRLGLPAFPEGFTGRAVYRKVSGVYMKIGESLTNTPGEGVLDQDKGDQLLIDQWNDPNTGDLIKYPTGVTSAFDVYHQYTEASGWATAITDYKNEGKDGKILDVRPQLSFVDFAGHDLPGLDYFWIQSFFAREYLDTQEFFRANFMDLFRLRRAATLKVRGLNWYVGQGVRCTFLPNDTTEANDYIVKKVVLDLIGETTTLEVYSI